MTPRLKDRPLIYEATQDWLDALSEGESLFNPGTSIWIAPTLDELYELVVNKPLWGKGPNFAQKLRKQVEKSSDEVILLAAEMLFVWYLKSNEISAADKAADIDLILEAMSSPMSIPIRYQPVLGFGVANTGRAKLHKWPQFHYLIEFSQAWAALSSEETSILRKDPWTFKSFVMGIEVANAPSQQHALLHLIYPDIFEPAVNRNHKERMRIAFGDLSSEEDPDRALQEIRAKLEQDPEYGPDFRFYTKRIREKWDPSGDAPDSDEDDASRVLHLFHKWNPKFEPRTVSLHKAVADDKGSVWWGKRGDPASNALSAKSLNTLRDQIASGTPTYVYLFGGGECWRTRLLELATEDSAVDRSLVPDYYGEETHHLWFSLTDFESLPVEWPEENLVSARQGGSVLGGQSSLRFVHLRSKKAGERANYFVLQQKAAGESAYSDDEGAVYTFNSAVSGFKRLLEANSGYFVYYRPAGAADGTSQSFFGYGRITAVEELPSDTEGRRRFEARLSDYRTFPTAVPRSEFDVGGSVQHAIREIDKDTFDELLKRGGVGRSQRPLTLDGVKQQAERPPRSLIIDEHIYAHIIAALESGKHVILTGPPGTGKTTLAEAIGDAAIDAGKCSGYALTTATSDWTTYETIGGLRPRRDSLEFSAGHLLDAIQQDHWLVIDELNRSNFDRAFGQLFTVLSGQSVVLPYEDARTGKRILLEAEGGIPRIGEFHRIHIPKSWRLIATMNVFDKSLLFEMSFALMRRFAFVEIPEPNDEVYEDLIDSSARDGRSAALAKQLLPLRATKPLGPVMFMDIARFMSHRIELTDINDGDLLFEAFYSYLLPQFEGIDDTAGRLLLGTLTDIVGEATARRRRLRATLVDVLGLDLPHRGTVRSGLAGPDQVEPDIDE